MDRLKRLISIAMLTNNRARYAFYMKAMALGVAFLLLLSDISFAFAPSPSTQNPIVRCEHRVLALVRSGQLRFAESPEDIQLLINLNHADVLLLPHGKILVNSSLKNDPSKVIQKIIHEEIKAVLQIMAREDRSKYIALINIVLSRSMILKKYYNLFPEDRRPDLSNELLANDILATAFELLISKTEGLIKDGQITSAESEFLKTIELIINNRKHNYFTGVFWEAPVRESKIRVAMANGTGFTQVANVTDTVPAATVRPSSLIQQEEKSRKEFDAGLEGIRQKDVTVQYRDRIVSLFEKLFKRADISDLEKSFLKDAPRDLIEKLKEYRIYGFKAIVNSPTDRMIGWNNEEGKELFIPIDILEDLQEAGKKTTELADELLERIVLCDILGPSSTVLLLQKVHPANYPDKEKLAKQAAKQNQVVIFTFSDLYKGLLDPAIRKKVMDEVTRVDKATPDEMERSLTVHNAIWGANEHTRMTSEKLNRLINKELIIDLKVKGLEDPIKGVLMIQPLNTGGDLAKLEKTPVWEDMVVGNTGDGPLDTVLFWSISTQQDMPGLGRIFALKAKKYLEAYDYIGTFSPAKDFDDFKLKLQLAGVPDEIITQHGIALYLVSFEGEGYKGYIDYIKKNGFITPEEYARKTKKKFHHQVENYHIGNGAWISKVWQPQAGTTRPDSPLTITYGYKGLPHEEKIFRDLMDLNFPPAATPTAAVSDGKGVSMTKTTLSQGDVSRTNLNSVTAAPISGLSSDAAIQRIEITMPPNSIMEETAFTTSMKGLEETSWQEFGSAAASISGKTASYEKTGQSLILYADDMLENTLVIDLENTIKKILSKRNVLNGGKIILYARNDANGVILEKMIKRANPDLETVKITEANLGTNGDEVKEAGALMKLAKAKGAKEMLGLIKGKTEQPDELATFAKDSNLPIIIVGSEKGVYSFAQAIEMAINAKLSNGDKNGWLITLPPIRAITGDMIRQYEEYQQSLQVLIAV